MFEHLQGLVDVSGDRRATPGLRERDKHFGLGRTDATGLACFEFEPMQHAVMQKQKIGQPSLCAHFL
jgi:hypothetical protein